MDLLSKLVVAIDRRQRRRLGIREFSDDPECVLRVGFKVARTAVELADGTVVRSGERIGVLHLWNEHMPRIPATGPDLAWARTFHRRLRRSFRLVARYVGESSEFDDIRAFGSEFWLVYDRSSIRLLRHLGLEVSDPIVPRGPVEWVVDLGMRVWTWLLRRVFNPESARELRLRELERRMVWISRGRLLALYGADDCSSRSK
jgi:hypothetical protein